MNNNLPPYSQEAEEAAVGSILIGGDMNSVTLEPGDFYLEPNRFIWQAYLALKEKGVSINQVTAAHELSSMKKLGEIGGAAFLSHLIANCPTHLDLVYYADIIKKLSAKRKLMKIGQDMVRMGSDEAADLQTSLDAADNAILDLKKHSGKTSIITPEERVKRLYNRYETLYKQEKGIALSTGLKDLDRKLGGGMFPGDYIVVGARAGMGKSTFIQQIANYVARDGNVLYCSGEMDDDSLSDKDMARILNRPVNSIRIGGYPDELYDKMISEGIHQIGKQKIFGFESSRETPFTTSNIYSQVFQLKERFGLALVVIDYLGILEDEYGKGTYERTGYLSRQIRKLCRDSKLPVLVAQNLNREVDYREDKTPRMSDLRDAGNIEQDAHIIIFLYRESYYKPDGDDTTQVLISKNRLGESGRKSSLYFNGHEYRDTVKEAYGN